MGDALCVSQLYVKEVLYIEEIWEFLKVNWTGLYIREKMSGYQHKKKRMKEGGEQQFIYAF